MSLQQRPRQELRQTPIILVGTSEQANRMREFATKAAQTEHTILLQGETGVGKDHLAELIHYIGRQSMAFVPVDCGALTEALSETELFGHTKGAFTDARMAKQGLVQVAENGTLFFNEVANISLSLQAKFLRILEKRSFRAVGGTVEMTVNTQIIAATNVDLKKAVLQGKFRLDLYHRLNGITFVVSPLRERVEDVPELAKYFLSQEEGEPKAFAPSALTMMRGYSWPGNVRELKNAVVRASFLSGSGRHIQAEDIQPHLNGVGGGTDVEVSSVEANGVQTKVQTLEGLFERITTGGESFWQVVYEPFMARDLTRANVQYIISTGLRHKRGNYRLLTEYFHVAPHDYKKFLDCLRKHGCRVPYQQFRHVPTDEAN